MGRGDKQGAALLLLVNVLKLLAEIALMALFGQWVLGLLAGAKRDTNPFYQVFQIVTKPLVTGVRFITPRVVIDRHVPLVAFLLLTFVWIIATVTKIDICVQIGVHLCK
jgi:hypothetical protein